MTEQKRGRGRPKGKAGPYKEEADKVYPHTVRITETEWRNCKDRPGGASAYIRNLIQSDIARRRGQTKERETQ